MPAENIDDDDYVASLLKQDAQKTSRQYQMVGMDAFLPSRARSGAPKPNTRFLRHIIRETDSHNSALLAREAEESRARLRQMRREDESKQRDTLRLTPPDLTDDRAEYRKRKRSHHDDDHEERSGRRRTERAERSDRDTKEDRSRRDRRRESERRSDTGRRADSDEDDSRGRSKRSHERRDKEKRREHSTESHHRRKSRREDGTREKHRSRRSSSSSSRRSRSPPPRRNHKSSKRRESRSPRRRSRERMDHRTSPEPTRKPREADSDSDPLEAIVGPLPPPPAPVVRARGRGAHKVNSMAMDSRFSSEYNPTADVHLNSDAEDEWGDALEALRDRQRWKQQGAERLKAAGFSDEQVKRWEKGDEKTEEDVKWALKGEGREWDRGKVVDEDGHVELKAEWGRLT